MMKLQEVTNLLSKQGIQLSTAGGKLNISNYTGTIPKALQQLIREREQDLIDWLKRKDNIAEKFPQPKKTAAASAAQKALWLSQQRTTCHYRHNVQLKIHIKDSVNLPLLIRSLNKLIARKESLRTVLKLDSQGELLQITANPFVVDIPLISIDRSHSQDADAMAKLEDIALEQAKSAYDLSRGPMFRASLLQLPENARAEGQQMLLFSFHQIVLDERSWGFLLQELMLLYAAYTRKTLPPLHILWVDYIDYACWKQGNSGAVKRHKVTQDTSALSHSGAAAYLHTHCVHHLFEEQVRKTPAAEAFSYEEQSLNYYELNRLSNQLAHYLSDFGIKADTCIGLCMEPSVDMLVGLLGILKAGGAYIPLDPADTVENLAYQLQHAGIDILLTQKSFSDKFPSTSVQRLYMDINSDWIGDKWANKNPVSPTSPDDLAYAMFAAEPGKLARGVGMPHKALVNLIQWQTSDSICTRGSKTLWLNPLNSRLSFQEIFATWCSGGTLVLAPEKRSGNYLSLWRYIEQQRINRLFMPAIELQKLAEARQIHIGQQPTGRRYKSLEEIIVNTRSLRISDAIRQLFIQLPNCQLTNQYGHPESPLCTAGRLTGPAHDWQRFPSIGKPVAATRLYILDRFLRPVPADSFGELYIGGAGLAKGYLNQLDITEAHFIANPFTNNRTEYLYKTGDLARFQADGSVELMDPH